MQNEKIIPHTDKVIKSINKYLPDTEEEWKLLGFISDNKKIYTFGSDSKIIGRLFEVLVADALMKAADELGYSLEMSPTQTVYPDYYFVKPNNRRIAIDVKTTYRKYSKSGLSDFGFTAGSFTSFLRNGSKNIAGNYSDYDAHYILGIVYTREENPTLGKIDIKKLDSIIPAYKDPEYFVQEKFRICGEKKGSGNTDNIGTIKSKEIMDFRNGLGPFSFMGEDAFELYWKNYPKYKDTKAEKESKYTDIEGFLEWLSKYNLDLAEVYRKRYKKYRNYVNE